jgi:hypothetical protein
MGHCCILHSSPVHPAFPDDLQGNAMIGRHVLQPEK